MYDLVLASKSPRRKFLLENAGYKLTTDLVEVSEMIDENLNLTHAIEQVALQKASALVERYKLLKLNNKIILSGDTIVAYGDRVFGKPQNEAQARDFLNQLSGNQHKVITGYCLYNIDLDLFYLGHEQTLIKFRTLDQQEILNYVSTGEPMDKAGAYGIQGGGRKFVDQITGDYENVVGLPVKSVTQQLLKLGWEVAKN